MVVLRKDQPKFDVASMNGAELGDSDPEVSEESESESESEGEDAVKLAEPSKTAVYNRDGLADKKKDFSWPENVEWIHKLSIDIPSEEAVDVNDDLTRELAFYTQALDAARQALMKFQAMGLPFLRPSDYYAEMAKSDSHMEKVKGQLLAEKKRIEESDERRKSRENKKIAKEVQAQKTKERAKQKKDDIESVKKWRKQRQQSGFAGGDSGADLNFDFDDGKGTERSNKKRQGVRPGDRSGGKDRTFAGKGKTGSDKNKKGRDSKDSRYGFGGKKGMKKQNTSDTTNDFRDFHKGDSTNKKRKR